MLMLLALALKLTDKERDVVVPLMIRGFRVSLTLTCFSHDLFDYQGGEVIGMAALVVGTNIMTILNTHIVRLMQICVCFVSY